MTSFPQSFSTGIIRWEVTVNQPDHFRAVRHFSWRNATRDEKALAVFGLMFFLGFTLLALAVSLSLLETLRRLLLSPHPMALREGLVKLGVVLLWALLLYRLWPRMRLLEARPGLLRFGGQTWRSDRVARLETRLVRGESRTLWNADIPPERQRYHGVHIIVMQKDGRARRVWAWSGRGKATAVAWTRRMAQIAGVPFVETH